MKALKNLYHKCVNLFRKTPTVKKTPTKTDTVKKTPKSNTDINNERFYEIFDIIQSCYYIRNPNYQFDLRFLEIRRWMLLHENYGYLNFLHKSEIYNSIKDGAVSLRDQHNHYVERLQRNNEPEQEVEPVELDHEALQEIAEREYIDEQKALKRAGEILKRQKERQKEEAKAKEKEDKEREEFYTEWEGETFEEFKSFLESKNIDTTNLKEEYVDLSKKG